MALTFDALLDKLKQSGGYDISKITKAYEFAAEAHKNQTRISGEPYIIHPLAVADIISDLQLYID